MSSQPPQCSTSLPVTIPVSNEDPDSSQRALSVANSPSLPGIQPNNQALPKRDPACENCTTPITQQHYFDQTLKPDRYAYGEIVSVKESVHKPLRHVLYQHPMAATSHGSLSRSGGKWRPGVVLNIPGNPRAKDPNQTNKMMLMATFGGCYKFEDLPDVVRHFCMPVSPHYEISVDVQYLHTTPEWQRDHVWLILPPCISSSKVRQRWGWVNKDRKFEEGCSFKLDLAALSQVTDLYKKRFEEWNAKCQADERYAEECIKKYQAWKEQDNNSNKSTSSMGGFPLIPQATVRVHAASTETSLRDAGHQGNEHQIPNTPGLNVLSPQPLSGDTHIHTTSEPSRSRHTTSAGDVPLNSESANMLGINLGSSKVEDWLSALPTSPSGIHRLPFESQEDLSIASAASTESVHDDTVAEDAGRTALQDATVTFPQQGTSTGIDVSSGSPVTTGNHGANDDDLPASTSASAVAAPTLGSEYLNNPEAKPKKKGKSKRFRRGKRTKPQ